MKKFIRGILLSCGIMGTGAFLVTLNAILGAVILSIGIVTTGYFIHQYNQYSLPSQIQNDTYFSDAFNSVRYQFF